LSLGSPSASMLQAPQQHVAFRAIVHLPGWTLARVGPFA
jgi:hypothetical protein